MRGPLGRVLSVGLGAIAMTIAGFFSEAPARSQDQDPSQDEISTSVLGNYLAGRFARAAQDTKEAADFYGKALERDPSNEVLLEQAFQMETMSGNWPKAIPLAEQLAATRQSHRMSQFLLGVTAYKAGDYAKAEKHFTAASENPIGELTSAIAVGWTRLAAGDADGAVKALDLPKQPDWAQFYLRYHRALITDLAGRKADAARVLRKSVQAGQPHAADVARLRPVCRPLRRLQDRASGDEGAARKNPGRCTSARERDARHHQSQRETAALDSNPTDGLAEVFYGLGEALAGEGGVSLGTIYLQLALDAKPDHAFALAALANALEAVKRYDDAIATYDKIPQGTPLQSAIDIRKAFDLNSLDKTDEAKAILDKLIERGPEGRASARGARQHHEGSQGLRGRRHVLHEGSCCSWKIRPAQLGLLLCARHIL